MSTDQVQWERRAGQRFALHTPVLVHSAHDDRDASGFTQDLSAKGIFFCTALPLLEGESIEITVVMPSEITLGESMRVRCRGRVLRVKACGESAKYLAAVHLQQYEFLPAADELSSLQRVSASLDRGREDDSGVAVR
jgi:PilZ domain-containing protein